MNIEQIKQLPAGAKIDIFAGTIREVYEHKTGSNAKGPWSLQTLLVEDPTGSSLVKLWNRPDVGQANKGQTMNASVDISWKHNRAGKGEVHISEKAQLSFGGAYPQPAQAPAPQYQPAPAAQAPAQPRPANKMESYKVKMNRIANLYIECLRAATYVGTVAETEGLVFDEDSIRSCTATLFIQATKEGILPYVQTGNIAKVNPRPQAPVEQPPAEPDPVSADPADEDTVPF